MKNKESYMEDLSQARRDYNNTVAERDAWRRKSEECRAGRQVANENVRVGRMQKINFEKRIQDIEGVVRKIDEMNRPIADAVNKAEKTDEAYSHCIRCDVKSSVSFKETFSIKNVGQDANVSEAKEKLIAERQRLIEALEQVKRDIAKNEQMAEEMQRKMNTCIIHSIACSSKLATTDVRIDFIRTQISKLSP